MPSPVGHALGGIAAAWLIRGAPAAWPDGPRGWWRHALLFASLGMLPDADLLLGIHRGPTHGIGAAAIVGLIASAIPQASAGDRLRFAAACALAYGSHTLLDWLGTDTSPPYGPMALWPFSRGYFESGLHLFMPISRRYWQPESFWRHNLIAFLRELLILLPIVAAIWWLRSRKAVRVGL